MKKDIERYELIEKYLKGKLTPEEETLLKELMAGDPEIEREVQQHRELFQLLEVNSALEVRESLNKVHRSHLAKRFWLNGSRNLIIPAVLLIALMTFLISYRHLQHSRSKTAMTVVKDSSLIMHKSPAPAETPALPDTSVKANHSFKNSKPVAIRNKSAESRPKKTLPHTEEHSIVQKNTTNTKTSPPQTQPQAIQPAVAQETTQKTDSTVKESLPVVIKDDCSSDSITARVADIEASCSHNATGSIKIDKDHISGGRTPYSISIDGQKHFYNQFTFANLPSAHYSVWIKDGRSCIYDLGDFVVPVKQCAIEDIFSPDKGERWEIPNNGDAGHLLIYNLSGKVVYELQLESRQTYYWNGISDSGQNLPMGVYPFTIDITGGEKIVGNVTVVK